MVTLLPGTGRTQKRAKTCLLSTAWYPPCTETVPNVLVRYQRVLTVHKNGPKCACSVAARAVGPGPTSIWPWCKENLAEV